MTATVDAGPQAALAAPSNPTQPPSEDPERQRQLLQALTTEHFTLQTARSATIADSNGRSALYLATVSSAVVALAFIGQVAHLGRAFHLFALALLPALVALGTLTYLRLVQTAIEDLFYARAINRIRRHYVDLDPDGARWFLLCGFDERWPGRPSVRRGCPLGSPGRVTPARPAAGADCGIAGSA